MIVMMDVDKVCEPVEVPRQHQILRYRMDDQIHFQDPNRLMTMETSSYWWLVDNMGSIN